MKTNIFYKFIASIYDLLDVIYFRNYDRSPRKAVIEAISENDKILDLCTGTATNAMDISKAIPASEIVGVDLSENMLKVAREKLKKSNIKNIFSGNIIPGVEITTTYNGETIEVLGYGFDLDIMQQHLNSNVLTYEEKQLKEYELIKKQYKKIGVIFKEDSIKFNPKTESCRTAFLNEIKKYPDNYKFFLYEESINGVSGFTRNEVYNPKSPLYVDESSLFPSLEKAIEMIFNGECGAFNPILLDCLKEISKDVSYNK